uniref:Metalloreductase n=1 Tax=Coccidioides posadasii RMSCC 3488 TaxID=454284 RepID=A0A0J6FRD2_COCPO|nr:metalloreductase [Coccidioides posadasii RMSCC 3488]
MRFLSVSIVLSAGVSLAADIPESARCVISVAEALSHIRFAGSLNSTYTGYICTNRLHTYSLYAAIKLYCSLSNIEPGLHVLDGDCEKEGFKRIPYKDVEPQLSDEYLASLRVVEFGEVAKRIRLPEPVLISGNYFWRAFRTNRAWAFETWAHHAFGNASYWFWGVVLLCGVINRLYEYFLAGRLLRWRYDQEGHYSLARSAPRRFASAFLTTRHWIRAYLILPPAIGDYHQRLLYWCAVPTRIEAIVIVLYYLLSLALTIVGYDVFKGNLYWDDISTQAWRYLSDRAGIMSYANLVLLWLFAGRNNPFLWATGWNFGTFNLFHRAVARVATIQAIIHSVGYTVLTLRVHSYLSYWPSVWWYMGAVGTIGMGLLLGFSSIWLRRNYYEVFLLIHIALSAVILIGLFIHTSIFTGGYDKYLWPVVIVWILERAARLVKLVHCNIYLRRSGKKPLISKGTAYYDRSSNLIRLRIVPGLGTLVPRPGQFYYIYQPLKLRGYESHPFTVGSWSQHIEGEPDHFRPVSPERHKIEMPISYSLTFWIRPFNGWTRRLQSECISQGCAVQSTFLLEGPYGVSIPLHKYENVILIAGGAGFAGVWPHIEEHLRRSCVPVLQLTEDTPHSKGLPIPATRTRNMTLIMASKQRELYNELLDGEKLRLLSQTGIRTEFYSTSYSTCSSRSAEEALDETSHLLSRDTDPIHGHRALTSIPIKHGRPNITKIINHSLYDAYGDEEPVSNSGLQTAVLVCGPAAMADDTRAAVRDLLKKGYKGIDYFEEAFNW